MGGMLGIGGDCWRQIGEASTELMSDCVSELTCDLLEPIIRLLYVMH